MKRTLIALLLAFGATAAFADPTLSNSQNQGWKNAPEVSSVQLTDNGINHNPVDYPFAP